jgi:LPXTG-motif cell wall-anchored protein
VNRVFRVGRRRRRLALVTGVIAAVLLGLALPASAHSGSITGSTQCYNGEHVITWHIWNSSQTTNLLMTIDSVDAHIGATNYTVSGYTSPLGKGADTNGTSTVPGGVTGTIDATVHVSWPDGITDTDDAHVTLQHNCNPSTTTTTAQTTTTTTVPETTTTTVPETTTTTVPETTTTTVPETTTTTVPETTTTTVPETTTTTVPETTTTTVPETTTTTVPETTTTVPEETTTTTVPETTTTDVAGTTTIFTTTTTEGPTTTVPVTDFGSTTVVEQATTTTPSGTNTSLPRTGSSPGFAVFFGLSCLAGGALLAIRRRGNWVK